MLRKVSFFVAYFVLLCSGTTSACPKISGLIDANCDGEVVVAIFGDSIVRGIRDPNIDKETGGYVKDLESIFPKASFINGGIPGIASGRLYRAFLKNAPLKGKTYDSIRSDVMLLGVGINDFYEFTKPNPQETIRNLLRLRSFIRKFGKDEFKVAPILLTINLTNTARGFQEPWVRSVNKLISANSAKLGPVVKFGDLPARLIVSEDKLHPDAAGYQRLARIVAASLKGEYNKLAKERNTDEDKDDVADWAENKIYFTNPSLADTDGDSLTDGREIFKFNTSPLLVDSDGDGVDDATELAVGTDPVPLPTPKPTKGPAPTPTPSETGL